MRFDATQIDTTPGAQCWAAPPAAVLDYTAWLRDRYRADRGVKQYLWHAARLEKVMGLTLSITGPHAQDLAAALRAM